MSVISPAPSGGRGELILQPNYFTSSIFVQALRDDITSLIHAYHDQYTKTQPADPFALFKTIWTSQGWKWLHFMIFDDRTRESFLNVALPDSLTASHLQPLVPCASRIVSVLLQDNIFFISPHSDVGPLNPRDLPRETFVDEGTVLPVDPNAPKKKGRPTRRDKAKKARMALDILDRWLDDAPVPLPGFSAASLLPPLEGASSPDHPLAPTLTRYHAEKIQLLDSIDAQSDSFLEAGMAVDKANQFVLGRLKAAEGLFAVDGVTAAKGGEPVGVTRVERAVNEFGGTNAAGRKGGALNLLEGAGKTKT
ncbi:hypothetical protein DXG03_008938 [Asterophora parasitica]|uniref:Uncharacterized protein n=1 Tax=Asterophora parasitica TaxID=117018 RepID=A0A9P7GE04_9AGAR|nr:hypothetical protein DXG03_008938 [Asterophora parasitica]